MLKKYAVIGVVAMALATSSLAYAQAPGSAAPSGSSDHPSENDDAGWLSSVKGMFGRGEDHTCATQATTTNAAGNTVYVKRPNCP